ncbi:hypothetical protein [Gaetbulibacter saemankumensis]|uniref:hypothetical protein n=1 Tax=Gaetbulibacter saemankumensis TaxID=311208 RepID=UPI0003F77F29|nr:hypothetical protein [Gaetbulibacter saemankumensis]
MMKNPFLKTPLSFNIAILVLSGIISWFCLLMGFAHLFEGIHQIIEGRGPDIPLIESILGSIIVFYLCLVGIAAFIMAIASIKGILNNLQKH